MAPARKVMAERSLERALAAARRRHSRIVFTNGCFDILHAGHVDYLGRARRQGDLLVVGLNSDRSVRRLKGPGRPVNSQRDRAAVLAGLSAVDYITVFDEPTPENLIRIVRPDVLVKGGDWKIADIVGSAFVRSYGGSVKRLPFLKGRSTTSVLRRIAAL